MRYCIILMLLSFYSCTTNENEKIPICYPVFQVSLGSYKSDVLKKISFLKWSDVSGNNEEWYSGDTTRMINLQPVREEIICIFKKNRLQHISITLIEVKGKEKKFPYKNMDFFFKDCIAASDTNYTKDSVVFYEKNLHRYKMQLTIPQKRNHFSLGVSYELVSRDSG